MLNSRNSKICPEAWMAKSRLAHAKIVLFNRRHGLISKEKGIDFNICFLFLIMFRRMVDTSERGGVVPLCLKNNIFYSKNEKGNDVFHLKQ